MFDKLVVSVRSKPEIRKPWSLFLSLAIHAMLVAVSVIVPLLLPETLAGLQNLGAPPPPLPAPTPVVKLEDTRPGSARRKPAKTIVLTAPVRIPERITLEEVGDPEISQNLDVLGIGNMPGTLAEGMDGLAGGVPAPPGGTLLKPPQPPPAPPEPKVRTQLKVGGLVQQANLLYQVRPVYPQLARVARVQGAVLLEAVISREGNVEKLRVLTGHPLLVNAALEAVRQWKYRPTLLNGEPVEVFTQVTVSFTLGSS